MKEPSIKRTSESQSKKPSHLALPSSGSTYPRISDAILAAFCAAFFCLFSAAGTVSAAACTSLTHNMTLYAQDAAVGGEVTKLQQFLIQDASVYPKPRLTGVFDTATQTAVEDWQKAHGVVSAGSPATTGFGTVGPKTRAAMAACMPATTQSDTPQAYVTQSQLQTALNQESNTLRQLIYSNNSAPSASPPIAFSNRIDQLFGTKLTNITVNGVSGLTAADIPPVSLSAGVLGFLPIGSGGTGTSTAPTYGKLLVGNASGAYDLLATSSLGIVGGGGGATLGANTFTGTQTYAPPSGTAFLEKVLNISAMDSGATLWRCGVGVYTGVNGSDPTANDVYGCGWNWSGNGNGRNDQTKPAVGIAFERYYAAGGTSATRASELHLTSYTEAGVEQRLFSSNVQHNGSSISTSMMADVLALSDRSSVVPFQFNITNRNLSIANSAVVVFGVNNTATVQQYNAAGNAALNLPYFDGDNMLNAGGGNGIRIISNPPTTGSFANSLFRLQSGSFTANGRLIDGVIPTVSGIDVWAFNIQGSVTGGKVAGTVSNTATNSASAHAIMEARVTATGGHPMSQYSGTGQDWYAGVDNNDNKYKINTNIVGNSDLFILDASGNLVLTGSLATKPPTTTTSSSYSVAAADSSVIYNVAGTETTTLLSASGANTGRWLYVKTITANAVNSASSNVVPLVGGSAGTAILGATAGKWASLQSDGTNWIIMAGN